MFTLDTSLGAGYKSASQKVRVMTETWAEEYGYCPSCGASIISYENNKPVADFFCQKCHEDFELKSWKTETRSNIIPDGSYKTMLERLESDTNPNFFVIQYNKHFEILNYLAIPKYYVRTTDIKPRGKWIPNRPNYIMCNIMMTNIPESGKIYYIENGKSREKWYILDEWRKTNFLAEKSNIETKWWLLDIMWCIERIGKKEFTLADIYSFSKILREKHPDNNNIEAKIRQQLQVLRDKGYLEFGGRGVYKLL